MSPIDVSMTTTGLAAGVCLLVPTASAIINAPVRIIRMFSLPPAEAQKGATRAPSRLD
jgi:hypothetical protein